LLISAASKLRTGLWRGGTKGKQETWGWQDWVEKGDIISAATKHRGKGCTYGVGWEQEKKWDQKKK